jgi:hypothetical protein
VFEFRADVGALKPAKRLDDGRLVADALITRPGVFEYLDAKYPGGIRRELRPESEVFSRETMDSLASMPITPRHPPKLLTASTAKQYGVGATGDKVQRVPVTGSPDWLKTSIVVWDKSTIDRMDKGDDATSVGYYCTIDPTPGVDPKFGRYDCVQRNIRGNHLAVAIAEGRAGELARVRMDESNYSAEIARLHLSRQDDANGKLTTEADGHQHLVNFIDWDGSTMNSGTTSCALSTGASEEHSHAWVRNADGTVTIAASSGHSHGLIEPASVAAPPKLGSGIRNDHWTPRTGMVPAPRLDASKPGGVMADKDDKDTNTDTAARTLEIALTASEKLAKEQTARADSAERERDIANGKISQLEKDVSSLRTQIATNTTATETAAIIEQRQRADALEAQVARFDETYQTAVRQRTSLMFRAGSVMGEDFRMDDLTDDQIRRAVVKRLDSTADVGNHVTEGIIHGQFEQLMKGALKRARQDARVSQVLGTTAEQNRSDTRSEKMREFQDRWKKPLSETLNKKGA